MKNIYDDYTDNKISFFICSPSFREIPKYLKEFSYDFKYSLKDDGIVIETAVQMIPEVIRVLSKKNIAIYEVYRVK